MEKVKHFIRRIEDTYREKVTVCNRKTSRELPVGVHFEKYLMKPNVCGSNGNASPKWMRNVR